MTKLTPFGRAVRNGRMEIGARLKDMADFLQVSSAYLSAVETGAKKLTDDLLDGVLSYFRQHSLDVTPIQRAAYQSQEEVTLDLGNTSAETREVIAAFARRFPDMDDEKVRKFFERAPEELD